MGGEIISELGGGIIPLQGGAIIPELGGGFLRNQQLVERGHRRRGRLARALWPDPERTLVASDRMARIDVKRSFRSIGDVPKHGRMRIFRALLWRHYARLSFSTVEGSIYRAAMSAS